jgi:hypothetical protein
VFSFLENVVLGFDFCDSRFLFTIEDFGFVCVKKILEALSTKMEAL